MFPYKKPFRGSQVLPRLSICFLALRPVIRNERVALGQSFKFLVDPLHNRPDHSHIS